MPKGKTDLKRFEKQEKRRLRNRSVRSAVRTYITRARQAITRTPTGTITRTPTGTIGASVAGAGASDQSVQAAVIRAICELDGAARKGVIHPNNAARRKSRLMKRLNAATSAA
jgi:small subunit ribosomal protein S20